MDTARRPGRTLAVVLGAIAAVALALAVTLALVLAGALHLRLGRLEERQTTLLHWEGARSVADVLVGSGRWRVTEALAPCGDANPEALIVLTATQSGATPIADVKAATAHLGWEEEVTSGDAPSSFTAHSADRRVHVVVEKEGEFATAEIGVDESCR